MLRAGRSAEDKAALQAFLAGHGYRIAPVTVDNSDWIWSRAYDRAGDYGARLADLIHLLRRLAPGRDIDLLGHTLGARVALASLPHLDAAPRRTRAASMSTLAESRCSNWSCASNGCAPCSRTPGCVRPSSHERVVRPPCSATWTPSRAN